MNATAERCLAIIPARSGSKGLPGKNTRPLAGHPLIAHSILCAAITPGITRTIVSTDSEEIAQIAQGYGADVPFLRPPELAADDTPMMPVISHAVREVERQEGAAYHSVLLLDPTSPCRTPEDIARAFEMLRIDQDADGVVSCSRPTFNPYWVGVRMDDSGAIRPAFPGGEEYIRRQDVPTFYRINGALYLWRRHFVDKRVTTTAGRQLLLEIPERRAYAVDDLDEFEQLAALLTTGYLTFPWLNLRHD